ncbi:hypothetical protein [Halostagnicola sp. A-GB9-2]|uniref:hypothetical protein n=1 Tax=Halostagnicola sp. A-GB9-2 TaxID=3048066 RepID=UPI0024C02211|nr:hypothetical protein [Halostagnicola sp. A-GB9-2]MDJ1431538.1 hypothetical protein [Halostagnicola sp. A-GB9-2]
MVHHQRTERLVPSSAWFNVRCVTLELLLTLSLLAGAVSLLALSTGNPETIAMVAFASVTVLVTGIAVIRLLDRLESRGVPALE